MEALIRHLDERLLRGKEVSPTRLRLLMTHFARSQDDEYNDSDIDQMIRMGLLTEVPHIWKGPT